MELESTLNRDLARSYLQRFPTSSLVTLADVADEVLSERAEQVATEAEFSRQALLRAGTRVLAPEGYGYTLEGAPELQTEDNEVFYTLDRDAHDMVYAARIDEVELAEEPELPVIEAEPSYGDYEH